MRKPRKLKDNATYHVTARANRGEIIFYCPAMRQLFLDILERAKRLYSFAIHNFCVMGNHIHLVIRPSRKASLSKIMQWILSLFARVWNKAHLVKGHVWGDRFFSKIIEDFLGFLAVFDYVSQNPVKAQLVKSAEEWEFGGLWHFITGKGTILDLPICLKVVYQMYYQYFYTR
jgi:putative transposase